MYVNILHRNKIRSGIICQIKEGIVFAFHGKWTNNGLHDPDGQQGIDEETNEIAAPAYEIYSKEKLRKQEYQKLRIGLERLNRSLVLIETSWQRTNRHQTLNELENMLNRQHEIEKETENIKDVFLRGYIHEQLDIIAAARRNLAEEVKWEIESNESSEPS